jgi:hypothetical protein
LRFWCCFFQLGVSSTPSFLLSFSISHLASFCLGMGMRYLSTRSAPWSSWPCRLSDTFEATQGLLSFGVLILVFINWFWVLFLLRFWWLIFLLVDGSAPNCFPSCLFYVTWVAFLAEVLKEA